MREQGISGHIFDLIFSFFDIKPYLRTFPSHNEPPCTVQVNSLFEILDPISHVNQLSELHKEMR